MYKVEVEDESWGEEKFMNNNLCHLFVLKRNILRLKGSQTNK